MKNHLIIKSIQKSKFFSKIGIVSSHSVPQTGLTKSHAHMYTSTQCEQIPQNIKQNSVMYFTLKRDTFATKVSPVSSNVSRAHFLPINIIIYTVTHCCATTYLFIISIITRSQAVARIADRTAKNCRGHVT